MATDKYNRLLDQKQTALWTKYSGWSQDGKGDALVRIDDPEPPIG